MHQLASALINRFQKQLHIVLKGADGENFVLPAENMVKCIFGKSVATGQYTLLQLFLQAMN